MLTKLKFFLFVGLHVIPGVRHIIGKNFQFSVDCDRIVIDSFKNWKFYVFRKLVLPYQVYDKSFSYIGWRD